MRAIRRIVAENYRMKHIKLNELQDLNILIGPNNCGKSSVLEIVGLLNSISIIDIAPRCPTCREMISKYGSSTHTHSLTCNFSSGAKYLRKGKIRISFELAKEDLKRDLPENLETVEKTFAANPDHIEPIINLAEVSDNRLQSDHIFPYNLEAIKEKLTKTLSCPEERLITYKNMDLTQYIREQKIRANVMQEWAELTREICDPKIETYNTTSLDFVRKIAEEDFETAIKEQGSGVRSLICLLADILAQRQAKIILVDEPELGLNPSGKQALLRFLIKQSETKQVFITTHDPTFVNPVLWQRERVALYLFSPVVETFIKIDLGQSKQDPSTFGGFLPHTTSLKKTHLYVEGSLDVYNYQIFLRKFLMNWYSDDWFKKMNNVGIFHLGGDCWSHFLYTIPQTPYHTVVILDGDKKPDVEAVIQKVNSSIRLPNQPDKFKFCTNTNQLKHRGRQPAGVDVQQVLVYCLQKEEIEDYLDPKPKNKADGPIVAEKMPVVPEEIEHIFRSLPLDSQ